MWQFVGFVLLALVRTSVGQITHNNSCPMVRTQPNFNAQMYTGRWFEVMKFPNIFEQNQICIMASYFLTPTGEIRIVNNGYDVIQQRFVTINGEAIQNPRNAGQLGVRFFPGQPRQPYNVLATDYFNYALVFGCMPGDDAMSPTSRQFLWVLARDPRGLPPFALNGLLRVAQEYGINTNYLVPTQQMNCPRRP